MTLYPELLPGPGAVYSRETLNTLAETARQHKLILLSDEIYENVFYDDARHIPAASLTEIVQQRSSPAGDSYPQLLSIRFPVWIQRFIRFMMTNRLFWNY